MNIIKSLTARIEEYRQTNKNPCKNYATEGAAEKATSEMAQDAARYFHINNDIRATPANYVVFYVEGWGRWVGCIQLSELLQRKTSTGGYIGYCKDFFTF